MSEIHLIHLKQMETLVNCLPTPGGPGPVASVASIPKFALFYPMLELSKDYRARLYTVARANSIPKEKVAQVFLTNQTTSTYKLLCILPGQQAPPKNINALTMKDIAQFMEGQ